MSYEPAPATAPPEPTPEQLIRAREQRVLPVIPERLSDPELRLIREPPAGPLADSYRRQWYSFAYDNRRYELTPERSGTVSDPSVLPPTEFPSHFVGSWHRAGAPSTFADCVAAQGELSARLAESRIAQWPATAVAHDRTWFEGFVLVSGLDDGQVVALGRSAAQPAVLRWDAAGLAVLPTGLRPDIPASTTAWRLESAEVATCPVRKDADPAGRCTRYGGPYGSSAIHAAALWRAHRSVAVTLLGCGRAPTGGSRSGDTRVPGVRCRWPTRSSGAGTAATPGARPTVAGSRAQVRRLDPNRQKASIAWSPQITHLRAFGRHVPRYRFGWEQLPSVLTRRLARELQLEGEPAAALRTSYGARPGEDFIRDAWPILRDEWLAKDGPARRSVVTLLRERRLGDTTLPVRNRKEQRDYLASCRNSSALRQVVLEQFRASGSVPETNVGTGEPDNVEEPTDPASGEAGGRVIRSAPPEFDLDKRLAIAWIQLGGRLTSALTGLTPYETLVIELPSAFDETELTGSTPYLQFMAYGEDLVRGELSSNHVLDVRHQLSDAQGQALLELGWAAPAPDPSNLEDGESPNFSIDAAPGELAELAGTAVATIRDVFGIPHPSFLIAAGGEGGMGGAAASLGLPRPAPEEPSTDDDEPIAIEPRDRDHLIELVDAALVSVVGGVPAHDDDGDIPIRSGSAIVFVRVAEDGPFIELFSPVLVEVEGSPLALERISQLNRWVRFVSFGWDAGTVHASMHLYCHPFVPEHLRHAVAVLTSVADRLDDELRLGLGGRAFFGEEEDGGTDDAPAGPGDSAEDEAGDDELPEALLTLIQLDADAAGSISAQEAAEICGRNRRDILDYIRIAEEQVIEWRSSAEEALGDGDREEAAACTHEGKAWQSTVDLLRSALRLVAKE
ncbi:MAG: T3SS (YopN, CesT) and YbjN peptide-binding chaperone 1 [Geodermatophilaceae bacterium]